MEGRMPTHFTYSRPLIRNPYYVRMAHWIRSRSQLHVADVASPNDGCTKPSGPNQSSDREQNGVLAALCIGQRRHQGVEHV